MKLLLLTLLSVIYHCNAYSGGAPVEVCDDMTPKHPAQPQKTVIPYKIKLSKDQIKSGENVEIEISGDEPFKGLLVQVRDGKKAVGQFVVSDTDKFFKTIKCHGNENSALTQKNSSTKNNIKLIWKAPNTKGKYTVYITIAKDGYVFWAQKPTEIISVF